MTHTISFSAVGQPVGKRIYDSARRTDTANSLPVRWSAPVFFFLRLRKVTGALALAGFKAGRSEVMAGRANSKSSASCLWPAAAKDGLAHLLGGPVRARFFFCPRHPERHRHAVNCRGLRLLWLLAANHSLRRYA